ncbi:MAG: response regulator transcription factor, partial [Polyangiaceae bacterium]
PPHAAPPAAARPGATPPARGMPSAPLHPAPASVAPAVAVPNGRLAGKLGELGLTPQQAEAVLALSRDVIERIVWEIVPQLAETVIREEVARLTKEG